MALCARPDDCAERAKSGEVDYWENLPNDYAPGLAHDPNIVVSARAGFIGTVRFNQLYPPFDNLKMRQAVLAVADQRDYMAAMAGDPANWRTCASVYACEWDAPEPRGGDAFRGRATSTRPSVSSPRQDIRASASCCSIRPTSRSCMPRRW